MKIKCARPVVRAGFTALVDATFLTRGQRRLLATTAERLTVPFLIVHCDAEEPILRRRVCQRNAEAADASEAGLDVLRHQRQLREPLSDTETRAAIPVDTTDTHWQEEFVQTVCEKMEDLVET